jgi:signal peptidase II
MFKTMHKSSWITRIAVLLGAAGLAALSQWIRIEIHTLFAAGHAGFAAIPHVLGVVFTLNSGVSFGALGRSRIAMLVVSIITFAVLLAAVIYTIAGKLQGVSQHVSAALILAGGAANLYERIRFGAVTDYLEFLFVHFAIFNLADCFISIGVIWMAIWFLFGNKKRGEHTP